MTDGKKEKTDIRTLKDVEILSSTQDKGTDIEKIWNAETDY